MFIENPTLVLSLTKISYIMLQTITSEFVDREGSSAGLRGHALRLQRCPYIPAVHIL